jgi:hypothetical protein
MKSAPEDAIAKFVGIFAPIVRRDRTVLKPKELDIYLPGHNLAIEFCGEYWHSHGDVESERKNKNNHLNKYVQCTDKGIRLITIFAQEWEERQPQIKRLLRNALNKGKGKVMARKCEVAQVPMPEARAFFEKYHVQGGAGSGACYGLYWAGKLVACMRFTLGGNDRGAGAKTRTWTLSRYATRISVVGGASKLFSKFLAGYKPEQVKSFSDNRYFPGGMYGKLGFSMEEETSPDYVVWSSKLGVRPKSHYQRRKLQQRLDDNGVVDTFDEAIDPRTEVQMTYRMGARRLFDCGKKRWVWLQTVDPTPIN